MSGITLSKAVRSNLLNLQSTASLLGKSQERLSSGLRVNSALDNPTNFFTAQGLNSRANDLTQLSDAVSNAVQTVAAADKGISAITKLVESAQATARQALQTAATTTDNTAATTAGNIDFSNDTAAVTLGTLALGSDVSATHTGTTALAGGDATSTYVTAADTLTIQNGSGTSTTFTFNSGGLNTGNNIDIANAANDTVSELAGVLQTRIQATGGQNATATVAVTGGRLAITSGATDNRALTVSTTGTNGFGFAGGTVQDTNAAIGGLAGQTLSVQVGSTTTNLNFGLGTAGVSNRTELLGLLGGTASVSGGFLQIQAGNTTDAITVGGTAATNLGIASASATSTAVQALTGSIDVAINGGTATSVALGSLNSAQDLDDAFTAAGLSAEVDATTGFLELTATNTNDTFSLTNGTGNVQTLGTNLVSGTTTSPVSGTPNPKRAELVETYNDLLGQIDDLAKDASFNGVNLLDGDDLSVLFNEDGSSSLDIDGETDSSAGLGLTALATTAFDTNASINSTLDDLKSSIDTLRSQSAKFGSNLSVVETRQDFTKQMVSVLQTGAANLTLADTNEEAANVLALQTRQQLSSTALSLASQADQNVLRLF
jgi:flagellin